MKKLYEMQVLSCGNFRKVYLRADDKAQAVRMIQRKMADIKIIKIEPKGGGDQMAADENVIVLCPSMMQADEAWNEFQKKYKSIIVKAERYPLRAELFNGQTVFFRSERLGRKTPTGVIHGKIVNIKDFELEL